MANSPLETVIINPLERPTSKDINQAQMQAHADMRLLAREMFYGYAGQSYTDGFVGDGFSPYVADSASRWLGLRNGMFFQFNTNTEDNIGAIQGLTDAYPYKAAFNRSALIIVLDPAPTTAGYSRIDRIEVRVPFGDERLKDSTSVGIFDSSLKTFSDDEKYKLLSSTLEGTDAQRLTVGEAGTPLIIYRVGTEGASPVAPPATAGYLTVALVTSTYGQANLLAGDISDERFLLGLHPSVGGTGRTYLEPGEVLLGNGISGITSTAVLPMSNGGTGSTPTSGDTNGSVPYLDPITVPTRLRYTQASSSGHLLASNTTGAPTWIAPGAAGTVLVSTGTAWEAADSPCRYYSSAITGGVYSNNTTVYTDIPGLVLADVALRTGNVRIELRPAEDAVTDYNARLQNIASGRRGYIRIVLEKGATTITRVFSFELDPSTTGYIALPSTTENITEAGEWTITVSAKVAVAGDSTVFVQNCELVASQG